MPGDLRDPEQLFPYYYDSRYEPGTNPFEPGSFDLDGYLQDLSAEITGRRLSPEGMSKLMNHLQQKSLLHRNPGDEGFREEVVRYLKGLKMGRKVALKWLTSTC